MDPNQDTTLTAVGPDSPMGKLLRRYWIPAAVSEELPEPGGAPIRVKLLAERLVAFRDPGGQIGLMREFCPHRGASLAYARNEDGGLRCIYHGWKIAPRGLVVETPAEPPGGPIAGRLCHVAYPTREAAGIVWTYMGPPELEPRFPVYPWMRLAPPHLHIVKMRQDCSFLQGLEGDLDPAHPNFLHRDFQTSRDESWQGVGWNSINEMIMNGVPKIYCEPTPYLMRVGAVRSTPDPKINYVRVTELVAPFYAHIGAGPGETRLFKAWHPIDDASSFTFYIHYNAAQPIDIEAAYRNWGHRTTPPDFRTPHSNANQHLQDRAAMSANFSGIIGAAVQDRAVQESMGPAYDHARETLASSDVAVAFHRRLLRQKIKEMEDGKPLPALDDTLDFEQRAVSCYMPADRPWQEARQWQERQERDGATPSMPVAPS